MKMMRNAWLLALAVASTVIAGAQNQFDPAAPGRGGKLSAHAVAHPSRRVVPPPELRDIALEGLAFRDAHLRGGSMAVLRLLLNGPAPKGGLEVTLKSKGPGRLAIPKMVRIAEGTTEFNLFVHVPPAHPGQYSVSATHVLATGKAVARTAKLTTEG